MDSKGLVIRDRIQSSDGLQSHKLPFAHHHSPCPSLLSAIQEIRPSVLIGVSGQPNTFTQQVCETMADMNEIPIVFALSNPTSKSECTAEDAYSWTKGKCVFASGSPFPPVKYQQNTFIPGQGNNAYIFPGIALGCIISGTTRIKDEMFLAAAEALASQVTDEDRENGSVYPRFRNIRKVSAHVAKAVATKAYDLGVATHLPKPHDLLRIAELSMYDPQYRSLV